MNPHFKTIITIVTLMSFLWIVFFSVGSMSFKPDGHMSSDCLFSAMDISFCPQDSVTSVIHHIGAYTSFLNVPVPNLALVYAMLLVAAGALILLFTLESLFGPPLATGVVYHFLFQPFANRNIIKWLSLFENSPSLF